MRYHEIFEEEKYYAPRAPIELEFEDNMYSMRGWLVDHKDGRRLQAQMDKNNEEHDEKTAHKMNQKMLRDFYVNNIMYPPSKIPSAPAKPKEPEKKPSMFARFKNWLDD